MILLFHLGYPIWRDCKTALTVFNKDVAGFTELLTTMPEALKNHPLLVKDHGQQDSGEWRYTFRSKEDENRHITIHAFLFNQYAKMKSANGPYKRTTRLKPANATFAHAAPPVGNGSSRPPPLSTCSSSSRNHCGVRHPAWRRFPMNCL